MDIAFRARGAAVPDGLRRVTLDRVTRLAERYGMERAVVCFSEERNPRIVEREVCDVLLFGPGRILRVQASATDAAMAAERALAKLQHRARRVQDRAAGRRYAGWYGSVHFPPHRHSAAGDRDGPGVSGGIQGGVSAGELSTVITKDGRSEPMTPEEAAVQMAGRDGDIYFFINAETSRTAAVYRRPDGCVGLLAAPPSVGHGS
jgi:ribosome-associated translation inhibitor RaiA